MIHLEIERKTNLKATRLYGRTSLDDEHLFYVSDESRHLPERNKLQGKCDLFGTKEYLKFIQECIEKVLLGDFK